LLTALGAGYGDFNALLDSGNLGGGYRSQSIILGLFAWLAPLRFVLQTLVMKKHLLAARPNEGFAAIDTGDRSVLKVT
jgi:hypothetical protein